MSKTGILHRPLQSGIKITSRTGGPLRTEYVGGGTLTGLATLSDGTKVLVTSMHVMAASWKPRQEISFSPSGVDINRTIVLSSLVRADRRYETEPIERSCNHAYRKTADQASAGHHLLRRRPRTDSLRGQREPTSKGGDRDENAHNRRRRRPGRRNPNSNNHNKGRNPNSNNHNKGGNPNRNNHNRRRRPFVRSKFNNTGGKHD